MQLLKLKKIGPCKILRKFSTNAYELELPVDMDISPIFNVKILYHYRGDNVEGLEEIQKHTVRWKQQFPTVNPLDIDKILDKRIAKRARNIEYFEYLVKWKGHLFEDAT